MFTNTYTHIYTFTNTYTHIYIRIHNCYNHNASQHFATLYKQHCTTFTQQKIKIKNGQFYKTLKSFTHMQQLYNTLHNAKTLQRLYTTLHNCPQLYKFAKAIQNSTTLDETQSTIHKTVQTFFFLRNFTNLILQQNLYEPCTTTSRYFDITCTKRFTKQNLHTTMIQNL